MLAHAPPNRAPKHNRTRLNALEEEDEDSFQGRTDVGLELLGFRDRVVAKHFVAELLLAREALDVLTYLVEWDDRDEVQREKAPNAPPALV